ncbi:hypothetical protein Scep_002641 [Stephania cephalantha]|uniref:Uncharacterized protein n=1 Tax=Stephania cephalantha TaxID=152367 RepID=A0AAP0LBE1_9MAGN
MHGHINPNKARFQESIRSLLSTLSGHARRTVTVTSQPQQHRPQTHQHHRVDGKWSELLPHDDPREHRDERKLGGKKH